MTPASMVQTCIEQLGPLTTTDLAALWWPLAARRTVQHYLAQYVAAGALVAHRRSCATGSVVRRIDTVYSLDGVRPIEPRPLGQYPRQNSGKADYYFWVNELTEY